MSPNYEDLIQPPGHDSVSKETKLMVKSYLCNMKAEPNDFKVCLVYLGR